MPLPPRSLLLLAWWGDVDWRTGIKVRDAPACSWGVMQSVLGTNSIGFFGIYLFIYLSIHHGLNFYLDIALSVQQASKQAS